MPYLPVMHIAPVGVLGVVKGTARGGAGRPVEGVGIVFFQHLGNDPLKHKQVIPHLAGLGHPVSFLHKFFHLVVAAPQSQRSVMADSLDVVPELLPDIFLKFRRQLIYRAGEHEILPHHQTQLIAGVKEPVLRIVAAAPYANHVKVGFLALHEQLSGALPVHPPQQMILGDIVGAHGKNTFAVHLMGEGRSPLILLNMHGHGAKADPALPYIRRLPVQVQLHPHPVKGLVSHPVGPPQLRMLYGDLFRGIRNENLSAIGGCHGDVIGHRNIPGFFLCGGCGNLRPEIFRRIPGHFQMQIHLILLMLLVNPHTVQPPRLYCQQRYRPVDTRIRQVRAPVPAEHTVGLPDMHKTVHGVLAAAGRAFIEFLADISQGRMEVNPQGILPFLNRLRHIILPDPVHVFCGTHQLFIYKNIRDGIQPHELQPDPLAGFRALPGENRLILIVLLHQKQRLVFIVLPVGILHFSISQKIRIDGSRHLRLQPVPSGFSHFPVFLQCLRIHVVYLPYIFSDSPVKEPDRRLLIIPEAARRSRCGITVLPPV